MGDHPVADAPARPEHDLREKLRAFGRRLALAKEADVRSAPGRNSVLYTEFASDVLPLAWKNVVDGDRLRLYEEALKAIEGLDPTHGAEGAADAAIRIARHALGTRGKAGET